MKKILALCTIVILLFLNACDIPVDEVLSSLGGYESKTYYTSGGFQDYTDYAKYVYKAINLEGNKYFKKVDDLNQRRINLWNL